MQAEPANQWDAGGLRLALQRYADMEIVRRSSINAQIGRGIKLSVKPEIVAKDIMRGWLDAAAPAGNA